MDLSAAFDLVPWGAVREALELAQVDPSVQEVMLQWLSQVRYIFRHKGSKTTSCLPGGLRQGCTGSPVLWSVFTALLCRSLDLRLYPAWSRDHATLYADDSHLKWEFETYAQFEAAMSDLRRTFAVFRRLGMQINTGKTKAIISITGPFKHKIYKHYVRTQGDERRLLLSPGDPSQWILLVDKAEYLGLIISYSAFEKQSVQHRVHKANQRRWALAAILHTRRMFHSLQAQIMEKLCTLHPDLRFALSHTIGRSRSSSSANHDEAHPRPGLGPSVPYGNHARRNPDQVSDQTGERSAPAGSRQRDPA